MLLTTTRRSSTRRSAFTLLEVLVVVAILVIPGDRRHGRDHAVHRGRQEGQGPTRVPEPRHGDRSVYHQPAEPGPDRPGADAHRPQPTLQRSDRRYLLLEGRANEQDRPVGPPVPVPTPQPAGRNGLHPGDDDDAPDGTPISQFGIGQQNAQPKNWRARSAERPGGIRPEMPPGQVRSCDRDPLRACSAPVPPEDRS